MGHFIALFLMIMDIVYFCMANKSLGNNQGSSHSSCFILPASLTSSESKKKKSYQPSVSNPQRLWATAFNFKRSLQSESKFHERKSFKRSNEKINVKKNLIQNADEALENISNMNFMNITAIMTDLSRSRNYKSAEKLELILRSLETQSENGGFKPNVVHYALAINGWANNGDGLRAESILNGMIENMSEKKGICPNSHCFASVMKAYNRENDKRKSENIKENGDNYRVDLKCEKLLEKMLQLFDETGDIALEPNAILFNSLLNAYSKESRKQNIQRSSSHEDIPVEKAIKLLKKMESGHYGVFPDRFSYCSVISALAKCGDHSSAELAEGYLLRMMESSDMKPDLPTENAVLSAWASIGSIDGAKRAELILDRMENLFLSEHDLGSKTSQQVDPPNAVSYNTVISAWVKSCIKGDKGFAARKAESVLHRMEIMYDKISTNSQSGNFSKKDFQPNVISYSSIIDCWSKSGAPDAGSRAQALLDKMELLSESGMNTLVTPNVVTYSSVLAAYGRSGSSDSVKKANELLLHMEDLYKTGKNLNAKPNAVSFFAVIDGWARCDDNNAGFNALALLKKMEEDSLAGDKNMRPNIRCYSRVLAALVNSRKKGSDRFAEKLITAMEEYARTGNETFAQEKPNVVCYNTLINSYAKRAQASKALLILNRMDRYTSISKEEKDKIRPDTRTLNSIIYSLSVCNEKHKARRALKILDRLEKSHISGDWRATPSNQSFNMVINACSTTRGTEEEKAEAMQVALDAFSRLQRSNYAQPDRYTYISLLKTCGRQLHSSSSDRAEIVENIFSFCCEDGLVDSAIWQNFILAAPQDLKEKLNESGHFGKQIDELDISVLPTYWTRNVVRKST